MEPSQRIPERHWIRTCTDLALCHGRRHVRALTLPTRCGNRTLMRLWHGAFDFEEGNDVVVWPPPSPGAERPHGEA